MIIERRRMTKLFRILSGILAVIVLVLYSVGYSTSAVFAGAEEQDNRTLVKVAFFPMNGYNVTLSDGTQTGMDVEYLSELCNYVNWKIEYVPCESWEDALKMLENHEVDLVGSAQYSEARADKYIYADLSSGYTFGAIAVSSKADVAYEDFKVMGDLSYGIVKGYIRTSDFYSYLSKNGIKNPKVKEYLNTSELMEALDKKEIDAVVHTFTEIRSDLRIIGDFSPKPFYYITYQDNDPLMGELNQAIAELKLKKPNIETSLMNEFYENLSKKEYTLSTDEKEYIKNNPILRVGYLDYYYPFSYEEDGELKGLCRQLIDNMAKETGFEVIYVKLVNSKSAEAAISSGKIDLLCYSTITKEEIVTQKYYESDSFVNIPMVLVKYKDTDFSEMDTIGIVADLFTETNLALDANGMTLVNYASQKEGLDAVAGREVDITLCDGYLSEYLLNTSSEYRNLEIESVVNVDHSVTMVAPSGMSASYYSILNKEIRPLSDKEVSEYIIQTSSHGVMTFSEFVEGHAVTIIIILLLLLFVGTMTSIHIRRDTIKINRLMYKDFSMDIWNLNYLTYQSKQLISYSGRSHHAIVYVNIMQFRLYNTLYGKKAGQKLLEETVAYIKKNINDSREIFARDHGDRFVMFMEYVDEDDFVDRLEEIKSGVEKLILEKTKNSMNIVMGVGLLSRDSEDIETTIANANLAMEAAKENDDYGIVIYNSALESSLKNEHEKEQLLKSVDINHDFVAYYQAKVDIRTNQVVGAEALVRFKDPTDNGAIKAPAFFVPYYEKTGKIMEIDYFVLEAVCKLLRRRMDEGRNVVPISVNFSRHHFMRLGFVEKLEDIISRFDIPKELIEVEITETLIVGELQQQAIKATINELREHEIRLSIDDFGSGYSSLGVFEQIPASVIKLDRSFLLNQEDRIRQIAIMRGIVNMADDLDAQVVCEGVENDKDVEVMNEIGAYIAQGYKYSKPIPQDEFEGIIDRLTIV